MQNEISNLADRNVDRSLEARRAAYADEVRRLVEASFQIIRDSGDLEPRVAEIVRAAGLHNAAFYRHFKSKDELLLTVLDEGVRLLADYLGHRMAKAGDGEARVHAWITGVLEQALQPDAAAATRPFAVSRVRLADRFPAEVIASEARLTALLRDALRDAAAEGSLTGGDPERDAETVYHLAMGWVQRKLADPTPPDRSEATDLTNFALRGLQRGD